MKDQSRWVRGSFLVLPPEITPMSANCDWAGVRYIRPWSLWVTPDSDVTTRMTTTPKAGSTVVAGLVSGAWRGQPGVSNAAVWECAASRSWRGHVPGGCAARQSQSVCAFGLVTQASGSNDESGDGPCACPRLVAAAMDRLGGLCGYFLGWKLSTCVTRETWPSLA